MFCASQPSNKELQICRLLELFTNSIKPLSPIKIVQSNMKFWESET